ncbi:MAG: PEP-CTERM sorting domain-containing protein [Verrucomicrobia bacterium]|nr:PEP-CTERM sorting domain-containing protein [Verrucomicrobiota bacterium]MCH8527296.1 PEP-CTERM sorting domain-containing protein [Kiritimatiellia bacterium]
MLIALDSGADPYNVALSLFSNDPTNNIPQNLLLELDTVAITSTAQTVVSFTSSDPSEVFTGGELYWLVLSATGSPGARWYHTVTSTPLATAPGSLGSFPNFNPFSGSSSWVAVSDGFNPNFVLQSGSPGQFALEGVIIPEPGMIGLLIGGALFIGILRRRKNSGRN